MSQNGAEENLAAAAGAELAAAETASAA